MADINDLDVTDANNTARFPENQLPSTVNNGARALEGIIARWDKDANGSIAGGGTADAITVSANQTLSAYYDGLTIGFKAPGTNTGAVTLNVDSVGAKSLVKWGGTALAAGEIVSGMKVVAIYDSTNDRFEVQTTIEDTANATAAAASAAAAAASETAAAASASAVADNQAHWAFDSSTSMADPGTGDFRLDNATISSATNIAVSANTAATGNPDISGWVVTWDDSTNNPSGTLTIRKQSAPEVFAIFDVTGSVTDNTTWLQIPITYVAGSGSLSNTDACYISFVASGDAGAGGDVVGPASSTDGSLARFNGTTGKLLKDGAVIGTDVQAYNADTLFANTTDVLTKGFTTTTYNIGNSGTGTVAPLISNGAIQHMTINGSHTLAAPTDTDEGYIEIEATNDATGGYTVTISAYNNISGTYDATANAVNLFRISKHNTNTYLEITQAV